MQKLALLVDDSRVARMTLKKLLVAHEFDVVEMGSGEEAITHLQSATALPDIIFMDVMMDGMDGLTATRQIKADANLSNIPVVICTGNDAEADIENALSTGAIAVLSKPPAEEALSDVLAKVEQNKLTISPVELIDEPSVSAVEPVTQVVDDSMIVANVLAQLQQKVFVELKQEMRDTAVDISRQVAADTAEQLIQSQVESSLEKMMPAKIEQFQSQITQLCETSAQNTAKKVAQEAVLHSAEKVVQRHIAELDLSAQAMQVLSSEGVLWLKHQQQQVVAQLTKELQQNIQKTIEENLTASLEQRVSPLVVDKVNQMFAQQSAKAEPMLETEASEQNAAIARLNKVVLILGVGLIAVAAGLGVALL
jgi:CheY-like chemotaxis protein